MIRTLYILLALVLASPVALATVIPLTPGTKNPEAFTFLFLTCIPAAFCLLCLAMLQKPRGQGRVHSARYTRIIYPRR